MLQFNVFMVLSYPSVNNTIVFLTSSVNNTRIRLDMKVKKSVRICPNYNFNTQVVSFSGSNVNIVVSIFG